MDVAVLEEDGARLQLDPGRIVTEEELPDLVYLVLQSIPAHVDLYRIYHGYDLRPIGVSQPAALDEGLLSDDSGIWVNVDGEDVKLSFGQRSSSWLDFSDGHDVWFIRRDAAFDRTWYEDRARLDVWPLDSEIVPNRKVVQGQLIGLSTGGIDAHPPALGRHLNVARSSLALDDDLDALGEINCGFPGGIEIEYRPFILSESVLSDHDNDLRWVYIDERFSENRSALAAMAPQARHPACRRVDTLSRQSSLDVWREDRWMDGGAWDARRWRSAAICVPTKISSHDLSEDQ